MADYSESIEKGVYNWLDANKEAVQDIIKGAVSQAIDLMAAATMASVSQFLNANAEDLKTGIAAAIATSWASRQHPVPK